MSDATYTAIWAKCATCKISYLRENKDADDCQACLRDKAAAFDALASCHNVEWDADIHTLFITSPDNELASFAAPTLAEAVRLAMEAEGER